MGIFDGFGLVPDFADKLAEVFKVCGAKGYAFKISQGLRTPQKQAEYYCKWEQRSPADIDAAADKLAAQGAPWLADLLRSYKTIPRQKAWLTNAMPGAGWHQWGEAADCYCYRNGQMVADGSDPAYKVYADAAIALGLTAGYYFTHQDSGHLQLSRKGSAADTYTWPHIDEVMKERFGDKESVALSAGVTPKILLEAVPNALGPVIAAAAAAAPKSKFYKDDPDLLKAALAPARPFVTSGTSGVLKALAGIYNRVGGLIEAFGALTGIDPVAALAVWYVESGGRDFTPGLPVLRFENHKFFQTWGTNHVATFDQHFKFGSHAGVPGRPHQNHQYRVATSGPFSASHPGPQTVEYEAFRLAEQLADRESACWSSSWGGPQVMGFNHDACGYASATALADAFASSERWHVLGFADFCRDKKLIDEIKAQDWVAFGQRYNGDGNTYGPKIASAFALKDKLLALPRAAPGGPGPGLAATGAPKTTGAPLTTAQAAVG